MTDQTPFTPDVQPVKAVNKRNDAAWIEGYIERASEPIDFTPAKQRIRKRKLDAIDAENDRGELAATQIAAANTHLMQLPDKRNPWEDERDEG